MKRKSPKKKTTKPLVTKKVPKKPVKKLQPEPQPLPLPIMPTPTVGTTDSVAPQGGQVRLEGEIGGPQKEE